MTTKSNRRKFLQKAAKAVVPFSITPDEKLSGNEKVKFLTADGNLMEIDKQIVDQLAGNPSVKTTNTEILSWTNQVKTKPKTDE